MDMDCTDKTINDSRKFCSSQKVIFCNIKVKGKAPIKSIVR